MPVCPRCDVAFLEGETHRCAAKPADRWLWPVAAVLYVVVWMVSGVRTPIDFAVDPVLWALVIAAFYRNRRS
jgi:TRAP-type C4-dicarboxylate transport system permease large subunit